MFHWLFFFIIIYQSPKTCSHPLFCCFSSCLPSRSSPTAPPIPSRSFKVNPLSFRHHYSFSSRYSSAPKWFGSAVLQLHSQKPLQLHSEHRHRYFPSYLAINDLQSQYSQNLFFSVKAVYSENNGVIPFAVRTQWAYTQWTKITFSFLAEVSSQIEAGYYQINTGSLGSCCSSKAVYAFIPFMNQNIPGNQVLTFLSGF